MARKTIPGVLVLALVCFFFTFVSVSCNGRELMGLTGIEMVTGSTVSVPQMFGPPQTREIPPEPAVIVAFLCASAALGLSFLPNKKALLVPAAFAAAAIVALLVFKSRVDNAAMRQTGGMIRPEFGAGFWGALIFCLGALTLSVAWALSPSVSAERSALATCRCQHCGAQVREEWGFCRMCGKEFDTGARP